MKDILLQHIDFNDPVQVELVELVDKGYVECFLSEETGELMFQLTDAGRYMAERAIFSETKNDRLS